MQTREFSLAKHDLRCGCWVRESSPVLLLGGSHVKSKEGKLVSWQPDSDIPNQVLYQFTGGHIVKLRSAKTPLNKHHVLVLLMHSDHSVMVGLWEENKGERFCVLANLQIPAGARCQQGRPSFDFTSTLDIVVYTGKKKEKKEGFCFFFLSLFFCFEGTHLLMWDLPSIILPEDVEHAFTQGIKVVNADRIHKIHDIEYLADMFVVQLCGLDYAFVTLENQSVGLICPLSGTVADLNISSGQTVARLSRVFSIAPQVERERLLFTIAYRLHTEVWEYTGQSLADVLKEKTAAATANKRTKKRKTKK
jgi:hypothetical protein